MCRGIRGGFITVRFSGLLGESKWIVSACVVVVLLALALVVVLEVAVMVGGCKFCVASVL